MDGNFQAEHMKMRNPENDVPLSEGTGFMVSRKPYELHLKSAVERRQVGTISGLAFLQEISLPFNRDHRDRHAMITEQ